MAVEEPRNTSNDRPAVVYPWPIGKASLSFDAAAAAAGGAAAAGVVRRARPSPLSRADRWRLEREAFRVRVHYVRRELNMARKGSPIDREAAAMGTARSMSLVLE